MPGDAIYIESVQVPRLETPRLWLRPWSAGDVRTYARILRDPKVMRYMGCGLRYTAKQAVTSIITSVSDVEARWKIRHLARHWQRHGFGEWAVEEKATGQLIGQIGLTLHSDWSADPAKVEIGWLLARHAWGRGFATEGARVSLAYAFEQLRLERIVSITQVANVRSQHVMQRIGLATVGKTHWNGCSVVWSALDRVTWEHNLAPARVDVKGVPDLPQSGDGKR